MATQPLALTLPLDDPAHIAAQTLADRLNNGRPVARNDLLAVMTSALAVQARMACGLSARPMTCSKSLRSSI